MRRKGSAGFGVPQLELKPQITAVLRVHRRTHARRRQDFYQLVHLLKQRIKRTTRKIYIKQKPCFFLFFLNLPQLCLENLPTAKNPPPPPNS